jgi:hypothetical protein
MELKMSASSLAKTFSPARNFALAAALVVSGCTSGAGLDILEPVQSDTGNYCVDQAQGLLQGSFGPGAKITKTQMVGTYNLWELWVRSNVCTDWIVFYPSALQRDSTCMMPAYGSAPELLESMWGYGDCANLPAEGDRANLPVEGDHE